MRAVGVGADARPQTPASRSSCPMLMMSKNWSLTWLGRLEESRTAWDEMLEVALSTGNVEFERLGATPG